MEHRRFVGPRRGVLAAVSGGPDSVALLSGCREGISGVPVRIVVGHVNHHLRGQSSDGDERFVRALAKKWGFPLLVENAPIRVSEPGNQEEKARVLRYKALFRMAEKTGCSMVLTAHTLDDQVETVFMNLLRGTGLDGLGGMEPLSKWRTSKIFVGRPLLDVSKEDISRYTNERKIKSRIDASNLDTRYFRNWLRRDIFKKFEKRVPGFKNRVAQLARLARENKAAWKREIELISRPVFDNSSEGGILDFTGLLRYSPSTQRRVIREKIGENILTFKRLEALRQWMASPPKDGRVWQLKNGWTVERLSKSSGARSSRLYHFSKSLNMKKKGVLTI